VWDYLREYEAERDDILAAVDKVFRSGRLILGPSVAEFERRFAGYCGVRYGVGVGNATDGIFLALKAMGIGPGDEVVTVPNTAVPTVAAIAASGATPRFVDICPSTYLMDPQGLSDVISDRTKCIIPVDLFGQCADMEAVHGIADQLGIPVLEDASQAHGATRNGRRAGSMGTIGVFSFYPTKNLGAYGDGGLIVTDGEQLDARLRRLRYYGMEQTYYAEESGYNSRLDEVQAEILLRKLGRLDSYIARRREIAARYEEGLRETGLTLPAVASGNEHAFHLYVVRSVRRDALMDRLKARGITLSIAYPWPIHTMRGYAHLGYREGSLPNTELAARQIMSLPMYPTLPESHQDEVIEALRELTREEPV
jgi:aminotransferase EvaB